MENLARLLWPYRQSSTTFDELRSSGELQLVRNAKLRSRISEHYDQSSGSHALDVLGVIPAYREHVRGMTPWPIQHYIWTKCYGMDKALNQQLLDCPSPVSESEALAVIEAYRKDLTLTNQLRFWLATQSTALVIMKDIKSESDSIDKDVQLELDKD